MSMKENKTEQNLTQTVNGKYLSVAHPHSFQTLIWPASDTHLIITVHLSADSQLALV